MSPEPLFMDKNTLKVSTPGDIAFAGNLIDIGATAEDRSYLVNNENPDLGGNHFDGNSARAGGCSGFDIHRIPIHRPARSTCKASLMITARTSPLAS